MDLKRQIAMGLAATAVGLSYANTSIAAENKPQAAVGAPAVPMNIERDGRKVKITSPSAASQTAPKAEETPKVASKPLEAPKAVSKPSVTLDDKSNLAVLPKTKTIKTQKPLKSTSDKKLPKVCNTIIYDNFEFGSSLNTDSTSVKIGERVPTVCGSTKTENYSYRTEFALIGQYGLNWKESKYNVWSPDSTDSLTVEGKDLVSKLSQFNNKKAENIKIYQLPAKKPEPTPEPAQQVITSSIPKVNLDNNLERIIIGVIATNPGHAGIGRFRLEEDGKYTLLGINNDTKNTLTNLSEEDVSDLLLRGLDAPTTERTAQTYLVEYIKSQKPLVVVTGFEFMNKSHERHAATLAGKEPKKYLEKLGTMTLAHEMAANYVADNTAFLNQIQSEEWVNFWKAPATAIIPLPGVESYGYYKTAGTGNSLVSSDYGKIESLCVEKYNSSLVNAGNCVFAGIRTEVGKYSGSYQNRGTKVSNAITGYVDSKADKPVAEDKPVLDKVQNTVGDVFSTIGKKLGSFFESDPVPAVTESKK